MPIGRGWGVVIVPALLIGAGPPETKTVGPVTLQVAEPAPPVTIQLLDRHGFANAHRAGTSYVGGGTIDVAQPSADEVIVTLSGVAVATDHPKGSTTAIRFELEQGFEVAFADPNARSGRLTVEARVIGLLRSGSKGSAFESDGVTTVTCGDEGLISVGLPGRGVAGGASLSVNDLAEPGSVPVGPGRYLLHQGWLVGAAHAPALLGKAAAAEFAPEPALGPLWVSRREPFHGARKQDFGLRVTLRASAGP